MPGDILKQHLNTKHTHMDLEEKELNYTEINNEASLIRKNRRDWLNYRILEVNMLSFNHKNVTRIYLLVFVGSYDWSIFPGIQPMNWLGWWAASNSASTAFFIFSADIICCLSSRALGDGCA